MSKRKGEFATFEDLIKEVGVDAARFFFLMTSLNSHLDFDLNLAKEQSTKNPVYYIQYAYVRAKKIIEKSKTIKGKMIFQLLNSEIDLALIKKIIEFSEVIKKISSDYQVNSLAVYASELAAAFHNFYEQERIIGIDNKDLAFSRLKLVKDYCVVLEKVLDILGVSKPKEM